MKKEHPNTSTPSSNTVTTREKALNWFWDELAYTLRNNIANKYFPKIHKTLTEEEIEFCYSSEHPIEAVKEEISNREEEIKKLKEERQILLDALRDIINNWNEKMSGYIEVWKDGKDSVSGMGYYSPSSSMVSSEFIAKAREALKQVTK